MFNEKDKKCYLCHKKLVESYNYSNKANTAIDHGEHIFQQALGGTLVVKGILCKGCGNNLGGSIDKPFVDQFKNITSRLYYNKDRGGVKKKWSQKSEYGLIEFEGELIAVHMIGDAVYPARPTHFKRNNIIYVLKRRVEGEDTDKDIDKYIASVVRPSYVDFDSLAVEKIRDLKGKGNVLLEHNLKNKAFKQGFAKIAIGFACYKGIDPACLNLVLDTQKHKIKENISLVPYYPTTVAEKVFECTRFMSGDWKNIFHCIKIKSFNNLLVAYIEIFGTYQISMLLSDCYDGKKIYATYMQPMFYLKPALYDSFPDRETYQIDCEYKLSDKHKQQLKACWGDYEQMLEILNHGIKEYNINAVKEQDVDEYYSNNLGVIGSWIVLASQEGNHNNIEPKECFELMCKLLLGLSFKLKAAQSIFLIEYLESIHNFKFLTWDSACDKAQLVIEVNHKQSKNKANEYKKYLEGKLCQISEFIDKYHNESLSEGVWEVYKIKEDNKGYNKFD